MESQEVWTLVSAALAGGGLIGAFIKHRLDLSKNRTLTQDELDRRARYLAIRIVCKLDTFVIECSDVAQDGGEQDPDGHMYPQFGDPTLSFPEDVDWKSIKSKLMYRILSLPNQLDMAQKIVAFQATMIAGPPDYEEGFEERAIQYGQLGLDALALADDIRETYGIPQWDYGNSHPKDRLKKAIEVAKKEREVRAKFAAEMLGGTDLD